MFERTDSSLSRYRVPANGTIHKSPSFTKMEFLPQDSDKSITSSKKPGYLCGNKKIQHVVVVCSIVACVILSIHSAIVIARYNDENSGFDFQSSESKYDAITLVWASGWVTAVATGLGAVPFFCLEKLSPRLVAICNAIAAGMMFAASFGLILEGALETSMPGTVFIPPVKVMLGMYAGVGFVRISQSYLGDAGDPKQLAESLSMKRVIIIMGVMTLHSFSEGVGIGVSYHSASLGGFISATLAMHNIPEGVAVSIVMIPRGFSRVTTTLFCILSSVPQPIMAVPAFLFVEHFKTIAPLGFGFAAGAMLYVAVFELLEEALESMSAREMYPICIASTVIMCIVQFSLRQSFS